MARSIRLRRWQRDALEAFTSTDRPDFLAVATPGAGKTTFALTAAVRDLAANHGRRLVVVAPTQHLKLQWANAAERFGLHLEPEWSARDGRLPGDLHGIVTTYQQVATSSAELARLCRGAFVVLDEVHHAGDDKTWGSSVLEAFGEAARRLCLSGTPFRSDTSAIPFVDYHLDEARPDFEYGYGEALADRGVVRPVFFPRINGYLEWQAPDGTVMSATFDDELTREQANQRLRTALWIEGEWLPTVMDQAHDRLMEIRRTHPDAGGLVIATDQEHARGIAGLIRRRLGVSATIVLSEDPTASDRISRFAETTDPWIVAVRMVSEGVDIPRLRVGVWATTTTTELFFRQAVGRLVRWTYGAGAQKSYFFLPDDPRLRTFAARMADQRRHSLAKRASGDPLERPPTPDGSELDEYRSERPEEQMSLFAALGSEVVGDPAETVTPPSIGVFDTADEHVWAAEADPDSGLEVEIVAPPPPALAARGVSTGPGPSDESPRAKRNRLRDANAEIARALVHATGMTHPQVNAELNRLAGVGRVSEATIRQLETRLAAGERLLRQRR